MEKSDKERGVLEKRVFPVKHLIREDHPHLGYPRSYFVSSEDTMDSVVGSAESKGDIRACYRTPHNELWRSSGIPDDFRSICLPKPGNKVY